jgi:hypothetical protein
LHLLTLAPARRALRDVRLHTPCLLLGEFAVKKRSKLARYMPRKHRHPFVPAKPFSRSASILCPRLSLDATVPMEQ